MKRLISAIIISLAFFASCSKEISFDTGVSFLSPEPEIYEETAIFRIISQQFTSADSLRIPITLGGTAEKGSDYEISAEYFTLTSESLMDSIVVSTKKLGTGKSVSLSLQIPEGFVAGKYPTSEFILQDKYGYLSFESHKSFMADTTQLAVMLTDSIGISKVLSRTAEISITVNKEKSTAVEGVDFKLLTSAPVSIAAGTGYALINIASLKNNFDDGKNKVVLNIQADEKFETGAYSELELNLVSKELMNIDGNWYMESVVTDPEYFESFWGTDCTAYELLPELYTSNLLQFYMQKASLTPTFRDGLERFFIGQSDMAYIGEMEIVDANGLSKDVHLISLDNTNRYFSETEFSEDKTSLIGLYLYTDYVRQKDMMELYILDHTSKSFMPELESGKVYRSEKPVAVDQGLYFCTTFERF